MHMEINQTQEYFFSYILPIATHIPSITTIAYLVFP